MILDIFRIDYILCINNAEVGVLLCFVHVFLLRRLFYYVLMETRLAKKFVVLRIICIFAN